MARQAIDKEIASVKSMFVVGLLPAYVAQDRIVELLVHKRNISPSNLEDIIDLRTEVERSYQWLK